MVVHHIVSDLTSFAIMLEELRELYRFEHDGGLDDSGHDGADPLPPPGETPYEQFVAEQRQLVDSDEGARQLEYWRKVLGSELPILDLPTDRPRPPIQSFGGATVIQTLTPDLSAELKRFAAQSGYTLFMVMVAAYQVLLHHYTGQEEILVGTATSGRHREKFKNLVGYLVNMVPLRGDLRERPTFEQLLGQTCEAVLGAIEHQDYPFATLVDRLQLPRDLSRSPLFQTSFTLRQRFHRFPEFGRMLLPDEDTAPIPFGKLELVPLPMPQQEGQFDLQLEFKEDEDGQLRGAWKYATDIFDASTVERMTGHFETLLAGLLAQPGRPVDEISLLNAAARKRALSEARGPELPLPATASVVELFEACALDRAERVAIRSGSRSILYGELAVEVRSAAAQLARLGVQPNELVALLLPRDIPFITWLLAINRAGAGFLPLNPRHPVPRLQQVLLTAGVRVVVGSPAVGEDIWREMSGFADARGLSCIDLSAPRPSLSPVPALSSVPDLSALPSLSALPPLPRGSDLAYAMFTSGSTGAPKGVLVEHSGMLNHVLSKLEDLGMGEGDVLAQTGPQSFDIVVWQCLAPLVQGGVVAIFDDGQAEDPALLVRETRRVGVTVLQLVPSMLHALIEDLSTAEGGPPPLPSLRWMVPTGDALPVDLCRRWLAAYPDIPLLNSYGSTECSDDQCHYELRSVRVVDEVQAVASIGTPIRNMTAYVLDPLLSPVPVGVVGDLYVGGIGVGRGYLGDPLRTADSFIPDPFSEREGARLYRTGDRGRRRADGNLEFLGRTDHMIKVRGFRIEPGEIEATLALHPEVEEAVVIAREHPSGERVLVAYVVSSAESKPDTRSLRAFLGQQLPQYMLPTLTVTVPALPLTAHGKIDLAGLPAPEWEELAEREYVPPQTPREEELAKIWAEVLQLERIGRSDDFFSIGGDSIRSIQIVARCKRVGIELSPSDLFLHSTVATLAAHADRATVTPTPTPLPTFHLPPAQLAHALAQVEFETD